MVHAAPLPANSRMKTSEGTGPGDSPSGTSSSDGQTPPAAQVTPEAPARVPGQPQLPLSFIMDGHDALYASINELLEMCLPPAPRSTYERRRACTAKRHRDTWPANAREQANVPDDALWEEWQDLPPILEGAPVEPWGPLPDSRRACILFYGMGPLSERQSYLNQQELEYRNRPPPPPPLWRRVWEHLLGPVDTFSIFYVCACAVMLMIFTALMLAVCIQKVYHPVVHTPPTSPVPPSPLEPIPQVTRAPWATPNAPIIW